MKLRSQTETSNNNNNTVVAAPAPITPILPPITKRLQTPPISELSNAGSTIPAKRRYLTPDSSSSPDVHVSGQDETTDPVTPTVKKNGKGRNKDKSKNKKRNQQKSRRGRATTIIPTTTTAPLTRTNLARCQEEIITFAAEDEEQILVASEDKSSPSVATRAAAEKKRQRISMNAPTPPSPSTTTIMTAAAPPTIAASRPIFQPFGFDHYDEFDVEEVEDKMVVEEGEGENATMDPLIFTDLFDNYDLTERVNRGDSPHYPITGDSDGIDSNGNSIDNDDNKSRNGTGKEKVDSNSNSNSNSNVQLGRGCWMPKEVLDWDWRRDWAQKGNAAGENGDGDGDARDQRGMESHETEKGKEKEEEGAQLLVAETPFLQSVMGEQVRADLESRSTCGFSPFLSLSPKCLCCVVVLRFASDFLVFGFSFFYCSSFLNACLFFSFFSLLFYVGVRWDVDG